MKRLYAKLIRFYYAAASWAECDARKGLVAFDKGNEVKVSMQTSSYSKVLNGTLRLGIATTNLHRCLKRG